MGRHESMAILGIVGNVTSILMFISPAPTFWTIVANKSTQQFDGLPYVTTLFNCLLWVLYGTPMVIETGLLLITINGAGVLIEVIFLTLFLIYADRRYRMKLLLLLAAVVVLATGIACITLLAVKDHHKRQLEVGSICVVVTVAMYASPLSVMGRVIQTRSVASMPSILLSLCMVFNTAIWTGYGVLDSNDIFVIIPNSVGLALGIGQLALHLVYGRNKAPIDNNDPQ